MSLPMKIEPGRGLASAHRGRLRFAAQLKLMRIPILTGHHSDN